MSTRVTAAAQFVTEDRVPVATAARVPQVSRQAVYGRLAPATEAQEEPQDEPVEPVLRLVPPVLPEGWKTMPLGPTHCEVESAIHGLLAYDLTCRCAYDLMCRSVSGES